VQKQLMTDAQQQCECRLLATAVPMQTRTTIDIAAAQLAGVGANNRNGMPVRIARAAVPVLQEATMAYVFRMVAPRPSAASAVP
jgi:hypothetical protein